MDDYYLSVEKQENGKWSIFVVKEGYKWKHCRRTFFDTRYEATCYAVFLAGHHVPCYKVVVEGGHAEPIG